MSVDQGIVFFRTSGVCVALYPEDRLAKDVGEGYRCPEWGERRFSGITLAHNTRTKEEVDEILIAAKNGGGRIVKAAKDTFWGGYGGYFSDPDGHLWEIAHADFWKFHPDGSLVIE